LSNCRRPRPARAHTRHWTPLICPADFPQPVTGARSMGPTKFFQRRPTSPSARARRWRDRPRWLKDLATIRADYIRSRGVRPRATTVGPSRSGQVGNVGSNAEKTVLEPRVHKSVSQVNRKRPIALAPRGSERITRRLFRRARATVSQFSHASLP
jgi:hypothetical protein